MLAKFFVAIFGALGGAAAVAPTIPANAVIDPGTGEPVLDPDDDSYVLDPGD